MRATHCTSSRVNGADARNTCVCPMCQEEEKARIRTANKAYLRTKATETVDRRKAHLYAATSQVDSAIPWPHLSSTKLPHVPVSCGASPGRSANAATPFSQLRDLEHRDISELMYPDGSYVMINGQLRRVNRSGANSVPLPSLHNGFVTTSDSDVYAHESKPASKNLSPIEHKHERSTPQAKKPRGNVERETPRGRRKSRGHHQHRHARRRLSETDTDDDARGSDSFSSSSWDSSDDDSSSRSSDDRGARKCRYCRRKAERANNSYHGRQKPLIGDADSRSGSPSSFSSCQCSCHREEQARHRRGRSATRHDKCEKCRDVEKRRRHDAKHRPHKDRPGRPSLTVHLAEPKNSPPLSNSTRAAANQLPPLRGKDATSPLPNVEAVLPSRDGGVVGYADPVTGMYYYYSPPAYGMPVENTTPVGLSHGNGHHLPPGSTPFAPLPAGLDFFPPGYSQQRPTSQAPFVPLGGTDFSPRENADTSESGSTSDRRHRAVPHAAYMVLVGPDGVPVVVPTSDDVGKLLMGKNAGNTPGRGENGTPSSRAPNPTQATRNGRKQAPDTSGNKARNHPNLRRMSNEDLLSQLEQMENSGEGDELVQRVMDELRQRLFGEGGSAGSKPALNSAKRQAVSDALSKAVGTSDEVDAELARQRRAEEESAKQRAAESEAQARREAVARAEEQERQRVAEEEKRRKALEEEERRKALEEEERRRLGEEAVARQKREKEEAERQRAEAERMRAEEERLKALAAHVAREEAARAAALREAAANQRRLQEEEAERLARKQAEEEEAELRRLLKEAEVAARQEQERRRRLQAEAEAREVERRAREAAAAAEAERQNRERQQQLMAQEAREREALINDEEGDLILILEQQEVEMDDVLEAEEAQLRKQALQSLVADEETSRDTIDHQMRKSFVTILEVFDSELEDARQQERERSEAEEADKRRRLKTKQDSSVTRSRLIPNQFKTQTEDGRIQYVGDPYISIIEERMRERRRKEKQRQSKVQDQLERQMTQQSQAASKVGSHNTSAQQSRTSQSPPPSSARSPSPGGVVPALPLKQLGNNYGGPIRQPRPQSNVSSNTPAFGHARSPSTRGSVAQRQSRPRLGSVSHFQEADKLNFMVQGHNVGTPNKSRSRASSLASNRGADVTGGGRAYSAVNTPRSQRGSTAVEEAEEIDSPTATPHEGFHWP